MPTLIRVMIQVPEELRARLDGLKQRGYTTSGYICVVLQRELRKPKVQPATDDRNDSRTGRRRRQQIGVCGS